MKFTASVADLKSALLKAKSTIAIKEIQPVLRNYCLKLEGDILTIISTDLELTTVCSIKVKPEEDGVITMPGDKLYAMILYASSADVTITVDGNTATILAGSYKANLQCLPADDFPSWENKDNSAPIIMSRQKFLDALNRISFSISDNEARKNLLAVYINGGYIQASDGRVSSVCSFDSSVNGVLIPSLAVPDLVRVMKNAQAENLEISTSKSFLLFKLGKDFFMSRLSQASFPDIPNRILKPTEKNPIKIELSKSELTDALQRVAVTANQSNLAVDFNFKNGSLSLLSGDIDGNKSVEQIPAKCSEPITFSLNYEYVFDICKSVSSDNLLLKVHPQIRVPIRIEDGDFIALLMRQTVTSN